MRREEGSEAESAGLRVTSAEDFEELLQSRFPTAQLPPPPDPEDGEGYLSILASFPLRG